MSSLTESGIRTEIVLASSPIRSSSGGGTPCPPIKYLSESGVVATRGKDRGDLPMPNVLLRSTSEDRTSDNDEYSLKGMHVPGGGNPP